MSKVITLELERRTLENVQQHYVVLKSAEGDIYLDISKDKFNELHSFYDLRVPGTTTTVEAKREVFSPKTYS